MYDKPVKSKVNREILYRQALWTQTEIRVNGQKIDEKLACGGEEFEEFN